VSGVVVQAAPRDIEKHPDAAVRSAGSAEDMSGDHVAIWPKEAYATGRTIREVAREKSGIGEERLAELLDARSQAG
jgi:hypothetical protein